MNNYPDLNQPPHEPQPRPEQPLLADPSQQVGAIALMPGGELITPADIPELTPQLVNIESANHHRHNLERTVAVQLEIAENAPTDERTTEQQRLIQDVKSVRCFAPYASLYENVYTPQELRGLIADLDLFSKKNRPDFNGLEGYVIQLIRNDLSSVQIVSGNAFSHARIRGFEKRSRSQGSRSGMQWGALSEISEIASKVIRMRNSKFDDYFIDVKDPDPNAEIDLSSVYQLVADKHALEIIGQRKLVVRENHIRAFHENLTTINAWHETVTPALHRLPPTVKIDGHGAQWHIQNLVQTMNTRAESATSVGRFKHFSADPAGAISLQLKIGHACTAVREWLSNGGAEPDEIVPLEL